jgi:hypothetical protein
MPCVLGHALSLQASHGGQAKNDTMDSQKSAALLRGGMLPPADVSPAERRAPRALWRRRIHLRRQRAALLAQGHNTHSQDHLPEMGKQRAGQANRAGGAERCAEPAVHKSVAVDSGAHGLF